MNNSIFQSFLLALREGANACRSQVLDDRTAQTPCANYQNAGRTNGFLAIPTEIQCL
ncbi:MAG: hypothetical protein WD037_02640 [Balneolales bacterium]